MLHIAVFFKSAVNCKPNRRELRYLYADDMEVDCCIHAIQSPTRQAELLRPLSQPALPRSFAGKA